MLVSYKKYKHRGFSVIELVVSMAILIAIMSVLMFNQSHYTEDASLRNALDTIALYFSQIQVYGVGVKDVSSGENNFDSAYGLSFNINAGLGTNDAYIYYADRDGGGSYDDGWSCPGPVTDTCLEKVKLSDGVTISSMCFATFSGVLTCSIGRVDVTFRRPAAEPRFLIWDTSGSSVAVPSDLREVQITLSSKGGKSRQIFLTPTGYASVQ